jgi:hypothetical protein
VKCSWSELGKLIDDNLALTKIVFENSYGNGVVQFDIVMRSQACWKKTKMKSLRLLFILFALLSWLRISSLAQRNNVGSIYISSVNLYTRTDSDVKCEEFERGFRSIVIRKLINDGDSVAMVDAFLKSIKYANQNRQLDVRAKFTYTSGGNKVVTICMNLQGIQVNGKLIEDNPEFRNYLKSLLPPNQLSSSKKNIYSPQPSDK